MKSLLLSALVIACLNTAIAQNIEDAPLEWLITSTLASKIDDHAHLMHDDPLVQEIFANIQYDQNSDEIILTSSLATHYLRQKLTDHLKTHDLILQKKTDPMFTKWKHEKQPSKNLDLKIVKDKANHGFYYFNHIHTNISQDNDSLRWLKYSPKETFWMVESFAKKRKSQGVLALCDHDTDRGFDEVNQLDSSYLTPLRSIEWGGRHHMSLIGIKPNWELLDQGREFEGRDSIIKSRSSEGFRIVNHPYRRSPHFDYSDWLDADGVEVWNTLVEGAPLTMFNIRRSNNRKALAHWAEAIAKQQHYTAVAGSDFHFAIPCLKERTLIYPVNFIPAQEIAEAKNLMHKGRVSILTRPSAPKLNLTVLFDDQTFSMGDKVHGIGLAKVRLFGDFSDTQKKIGGVCYNVIRNFHRLFTFWKNRFWEVRFYNQAGELVVKKQIDPKNFGSFRHFRAEFDLEINQTDLIRAEIWEVNQKSKSVDLVAATNPIYFN